MRWQAEASNSFLARLQWSVRRPGEVNHPPVAVVDGDRSRAVLHRASRPGSTLTLDASTSHDPDGDTLRYRWFVQPMPGSVVDFPLPDTPSSRLQVTPVRRWAEWLAQGMKPELGTM